MAEHRKRVIAGGKKFKYPIQYSRHKLVINTIIISVSALLVVIAIGWWVLYPNQNTSEFMYRVTRVVPVPVASVDGERVRYSEYLMQFKSAEHYFREIEPTNFGGEDGQRQIKFVKQQSMMSAVTDAYAMKLAREHSITTTDAELEEFMQQQRVLADGEVSESVQEVTVRDYYNWSFDDLRHMMRMNLIRQKVKYAIDDTARNHSEAIAKLLEADDGRDLRAIVERDTNNSMQGISYAAPGWVPRNNLDGGLTSEAIQLKEGETSTVITPAGGDGYYFIRLLESREREVRYEYIRIPLRVFDQRLQELFENDKVRYYIDVPKPGEETPQQ